MSNSAQKFNLQDAKNGVVSAAGRVGHALLTPRGGWGADNIVGHDDETKKQYIISQADIIITGIFITVAAVVTSTLGTYLAMGVAAVALIHSNISVVNYKLANLNYLLGKRDAAQIKELMSEHEKIAKELEKYKGMAMKDIPADLRKRSYSALTGEYRSIKKLKAAINKLK